MQPENKGNVFAVLKTVIGEYLLWDSMYGADFKGESKWTLVVFKSKEM